MLTGVSRNGPADLAGIRSKDVIVSLAGKKIETIYDYTDAISNCEPNVETIIKVMRNGKIMALKIIPTEMIEEIAINLPNFCTK